jgi:transcription elongation factor GreA
LEGRIRELEHLLKNAQVIAETKENKNTVTLGRTVIVREVGTDLEEEYTIVGPPEANPAEGRISNESPMGKALIGKKVGQVVKVTSPGGLIEFEIIKVNK